MLPLKRKIGNQKLFKINLTFIGSFLNGTKDQSLNELGLYDTCII